MQHNKAIISFILATSVLILGCLPVEGWSGDRSAPFGVGEQLKFKVYFEFILGGDAVMSVQSIEEVDGRPCYKIVSEARSTPTVDLMYKVRDRIESYRDTATTYSRYYFKQLREGKWKDDKRVEYKPDKGQIILSRKAHLPLETMTLDKAVFDVLNAFYEVRTRQLEVGKSIFLDVHDIDKQYLLEVKVLNYETVELPAGTFNCFVIEPQLKSSGIFRREGSLQIWLTDDVYKMPVLMKSKLYFGSVWARLISFKRGSK
ncbi:MAG: DUF3108 domain-containing protein [Calditrichaeota bacterium]|nr:DUF3108 domain-containing protein [Calditrichota bacterium]